MLKSRTSWSSADRPDDLEAGLRFLAADGVDLIVTSGGLGPTADDLTAEVVARFAGLEMLLDEGMEAKIAEILSGFAKRLGFDLDALRDANRKQAMVPVGATTIDPAGTAPGLVVAGRRRPDRDRHARAAARAAGDVAEGARDRSGARGPSQAEPYDGRDAPAVRRAGVRDREEPAGDRGRGR